MALSIEAVYVTKDNVKQILAKAAYASRSVSVEAGYLTEETKEQILQKGHSQATSLSGKTKDYKPE